MKQWLNQDEKASGDMTGLTFLFTQPIAVMSSNGISWSESQVGNYVRADGLSKLAPAVKSAIAPVEKRSIVTEQYGGVQTAIQRL